MLELWRDEREWLMFDVELPVELYRLRAGTHGAPSGAREGIGWAVISISFSFVTMVAVECAHAAEVVGISSGPRLWYEACVELEKRVVEKRGEVLRDLFGLLQATPHALRQHF